MQQANNDPLYSENMELTATGMELTSGDEFIQSSGNLEERIRYNDGLVRTGHSKLEEHTVIKLDESNKSIETDEIVEPEGIEFGKRDRDLDQESSEVDVQLESDTDKNSEIDEQLRRKGVNENSEFESDSNNKLESSSTKRFLTLIDSDSEEEMIFPETKDKKQVQSKDEEVTKESFKQRHKSIKKLVNKKYDDEQNDSKFKKQKSKKKRVINSDSESEGENKENKNEEEEKDTVTISKLETLIDSESEEEEHNQSFPREVPGEIKSGSKKQATEKKRKGSIRAAKDEAMKQIHSETQRLIRESEVSLPYHKPKQRTLQEFLNRKKISTALPNAPTMAAKLKMSSVIVNEVLEEKEKEAELFYKSSDSEDEEKTQDVTAQKIDNLEKHSVGNVIQNITQEPNKTVVESSNKKLNEDSESLTIEETQKLMKQVQDFHKKKEIIQQGNMHLGVPRKLFDSDLAENINDDLNDIADDIFNEGFTEKITNSPLINKHNSEDKDKVIPKNKEYKQGLRDFSIPRKLIETLVDIGKTNDAEQDKTEPLSEKQELPVSISKENSTNDLGNIFETPHINKEEFNKLQEKNKAENCGGLSRSDEEVFKLTDDELETIITGTDIAKTKEDSGLSSMTSDSVKIADQVDNEEIVSMNVNEQTTDNIATGSSKNNLSSYATTVRNCLGIDKSDDYNEYGLPPPNFDEEISKLEKQQTKRASIKEELLSKLPRLEPKIKGSPGMVIDLTADVKPKQEGVNNLIDRFFCKHSKARNSHGENSDVSVIYIEDTSSGPVAMKQKLPYKTPEVQVESKELSKPGAKLQRLKEELKLKMAMRRDEEWKLKEEQMKNELEAEEEELTLEDKEEEIEDSEEAETEPEEDDIIIKERKSKRCAFADDEAEESEGEDGDDDADNDEGFENEGESDVEDIKKSDDENTEEEKEDEENEVEDEKEDRSRRNLRRIIKAFEEDSNMSNTASVLDEMEGSLQNAESSKNLGTGDTSNNPEKRKEKENNLKLYQNKEENSKEKMEERNFKSLTDFFKSDFKLKTKDEKEDKNWSKKESLNLNEDEGEEQMALSQKLGGKASFSRRGTDVDIFASETEEDVRTTQDNLEFSQTPLNKGNILDLISPATQLTVLNTKLDSSRKDEYFFGKREITPKKRMSLQKKLFDDSPEINDDDLLQLCSGKFSSQGMNFEGKPHKEEKEGLGLSDESEITDSQLVALCSGSFNTPVLKHTDKKVLAEKSEEKEVDGRSIHKSATGLRLVFSDDEDDENITRERKKRCKRKKLELSDDSEQEKSEDSEEEEIENLENSEDEDKFVDYDSEENEVVIVPKKDIKKYAAEFLENEAELSDESDYQGSDDEDEGEMDQLELEEGDAEEIDENKMRDQLGRLHMKQMLDEDQRDVRILKEILFEDGDLHTDGSGRERKFRWKNIDKLGEEKDQQDMSEDKDGWLDVPDDENEVEWRKMRHEREKFLAEKKEQSDDDVEAELNGCEIFKLGVKALKKIEITQSLRQNNSVEMPKAPHLKISHTISELLNSSDLETKSKTVQTVMQKRSLLARSEESLARIAMLARQNEPSTLAKATRNFVFAHISPSLKEEESSHENVESKFEGTDSGFKYRKRKAMSNATPRSVKRTKLDSVSRGKKLF